MLQFTFYEPVYCAKYEGSFPKDTTECVGRFVGIADTVGHAMTFYVLTEIRKVIARAVLRTARKTGPCRNLKADPDVEALQDDDDEDDGHAQEFRKQALREAEEDSLAQQFLKDVKGDIVRSRATDKGIEPPVVDIKGLLGRTFISNPDDNGEQQRAKIIQVTPTVKRTPDGKDAIVRFKCKHGNRMFEEVLSYNKMLEWCNRDVDRDDMFKIDGIISHRKAKLKDSTGPWEVLVKWSSGQATWNCLNLTYTDDPMSVTMCAIKNNLLDLPVGLQS